MFPFSYDYTNDQRKIFVLSIVGTYFDEKVKMAEVIVTARRRITPHNVLSIYLSLYCYVLSYWKAEDVIRVRECETVAEEQAVSTTSR